MDSELSVKKGVITESKLVDLFATGKVKQKYQSSNNMFTSSNKASVLKQASRYCEILDLGNRKYRIAKVYKYPVPKNFSQMNSGLHQYLTPLILINLVASGIYQVKNLTFTTNKWYRMVDMINANYAKVKLNFDYASEKLNVGKNVLYDFYNATDDALMYYFKKSLEHLKAANLFNFQEINWVYVRSVDVKHNEYGKQCINIRPEHRRATAVEMVYIRKCEELARKHAGILPDDESAKYYGPKSKKFLTKLKELLLEQNILFCYKAYEIYSTDFDIQRCHQLLESFEINEKSELIELTNGIFQKNLRANAKLRIANNPEKRGLIGRDGLISQEDAEKFLKDFSAIINLTLKPAEEAIAVPESYDSLGMEHINKILHDNVEVLDNGHLLSVWAGKVPDIMRCEQ